MPRKRLAGRFAVRWLLVVPFLLLGANFLLNRGVAFDDAWITYRYARNLSAGHGLVFNPGDANPTEGFTSILHVLISCVGLRAGIPPLAFTWLANLVLLAALPFVALAGLRRHWTGAPVLSLIPMGLYLSADITAWQASTGMETIFFASGVFLLALLAADVALRSSLRGSAILGLAGFVLVLVRPEAGLLFAAHLGILAFQSRFADIRRTAGVLASAGGTFALGLGTYLIWKWRYLGHLLPNSYYVKTRGGVFGLPSEAWPGLRHVILYLGSYDQAMPQALLTLLLVLLVRPRAARSRTAATLMAHHLIPVAALLVYYTSIVHESCMFRLEFTALLPVLYSASILLAEPKGLLHGPHSLNDPLVRTLGALVVGFTVLAANLGNLRHLPGAFRSAGLLPNDTIYVRFGEDLKRAGLGNSLVLMTGAVGITPYLSDATTLDFVGLTDDFFSGRAPKEASEVERYYRSRNPDVILAKWPPAAAARKEDDRAFRGLLRGLAGKYPEGLMVRLYRSERYLEFVHRVMVDLRERYEVLAVYGGGPYVVYLRRDFARGTAVRRAFGASPYVLRGIDPAAYVAMKVTAGEMDPY